MKRLTPTPILNLETAEEKKNVLNSFDLVMSDIEGVFHKMSEDVELIKETICLLRHTGKLVKFVTDDTLHNDEYFIEKLSECGISNVTENDLMYPAKAMCYYVARNNGEDGVISLCTPKTNEMISKHLSLMTSDSLPYFPLRIDNLSSAVRPRRKVVAVLLDTNFNLTYAELVRAQQHLHSEGCRLLVGSLDAYVKIDENFQAIGNAGFINMLSECTNKEPLLMNKKGPFMAELICQQNDVSDPQRVLFVGTSLASDIEFGNRGGFQTLLLLTKETAKTDLTKLNDRQRPDYVANNFTDLINLFARKYHCAPRIEAKPKVVKRCCSPPPPLLPELF